MYTKFNGSEMRTPHESRHFSCMSKGASINNKSGSTVECTLTVYAIITGYTTQLMPQCPSHPTLVEQQSVLDKK